MNVLTLQSTYGGLLHDTGQNAVQKLVALFTVAAALPTGTVHRFAGVVQQPQ